MFINLLISLLVFILLSLVTIVPILLTVAFFTLLERKLLASVHRRRGPSFAGFWGVLQPFADGVKLVIKEFILPGRANFYFFSLSPI